MSKLSFEDIQCVEFKERHYKVMYRDSICKLDLVFDQIPKPGVENKLYCVKLFRMILALKRKERTAFLNYQLELCQSEFHWAVSLDKLLSNNWRLMMRLGHSEVLDDWIKLLEDRISRLYPKAWAKYQFLPLDPPTPIQEATPCCLKFSGKTNEIGGLFYQLQNYQTENGERLCLNDYKEIAEHIHRYWRKADGSKFNLNSLLTILRPSRSDKRPKEGDGISLDELMGGE